MLFFPAPTNNPRPSPTAKPVIAALLVLGLLANVGFLFFLRAKRHGTPPQIPWVLVAIGVGAVMAFGLLMFALSAARRSGAEGSTRTGPYCSQCGAAVQPGAKFCSQCGESLPIPPPDRT